MKNAKELIKINQELCDSSTETRLVYNWSQIVSKRKKRKKIKQLMVLVPTVAVSMFLAGILIFNLLPSSEKKFSAQPLQLHLGDQSSTITVPKQATKNKNLSLSDGSALSISPGTTLQVINNSEKKFKTRLQNGWARFTVKTGKDKIWEIETDHTRIRVLGTQFTVNTTNKFTTVTVHRGRVELEEENKKVILSMGQAKTLYQPANILEPPPNSTLEVQIASHELTLSENKDIESTPEDKDKQNVPQLHHTKSTFTKPDNGQNQVNRHDVNQLLDAADKARKEQNPKKAANLLENLIKNHPNNHIIGLAYLSLGRIQLDDLKNAQGAVTALKRAINSGTLPAPLLEQAYARCIEAMIKANDFKAAKKMADDYITQFPQGTWKSFIQNNIDSIK